MRSIAFGAVISIWHGFDKSQVFLRSARAASERHLKQAAMLKPALRLWQLSPPTGLNFYEKCRFISCVT